MHTWKDDEILRLKRINMDLGQALNKAEWERDELQKKYDKLQQQDAKQQTDEINLEQTISELIKVTHKRFELELDSLKEQTTSSDIKALVDVTRVLAAQVFNLSDRLSHIEFSLNE